MEYNELIEKVQHTSIDVPDSDTILAGMRRTLYRRRQRKTLLLTTVCLLLISFPLIFPLHYESNSPTLVEVVSATFQSSPNDLPAPLAGYRNSIRNHQTTTVI